MIRITKEGIDHNPPSREELFQQLPAEEKIKQLCRLIDLSKMLAFCNWKQPQGKGIIITKDGLLQQ